MKPAALKFRFGHSGFTPDDADPGTARGTWLATKLGCSVYALTGVPESVRDAIRDALGGQTAVAGLPDRQHHRAVERREVAAHRQGRRLLRRR